MKAVILALCLSPCSLVAASLLPEPAPIPISSTSHDLSEFGLFLLAKQNCCRYCKKGKACGDSCIARKKRCKEPKGCACNDHKKDDDDDDDE